MSTTTRLVTAMVLGLAAGGAQAATITTLNNNFTMLDGGNGLTGGTNDVTFTWDGSLNSDPAAAVTNATLSSPTPFFGLTWTAYNVQIYGPGSYTLSTADAAGGGGCPFGGLTCYSGGTYSVTVGAGQLMAHMKFAWGTSQGIDVVNVWQPGDWTLLNPGDPICATKADCNTKGTYLGPAYDHVSIDWDHDGDAGGKMIDGPFQGFNANFNVNGVVPVPVPAAIGLFGSGLLGLAGVARRRIGGWGSTQES